MVERINGPIILTRNGGGVTHTEIDTEGLSQGQEAPNMDIEAEDVDIEVGNTEIEIGRIDTEARNIEKEKKNKDLGADDTDLGIGHRKQDQDLPGWRIPRI